MTATVAARPTTFRQLEAASVRPASADGSAVAVELRVPLELRPDFDFVPGQHVTVRFTQQGRSLRRTYSVCSTPAELHRDGVLRLGVRRVTGGAFAACLDSLADGGELAVTTPSGRFGLTSPPAGHGRYAAIVAGAGITPLLPLLDGVLRAEPASTFALLYANRTAASAMFVDELADLKDTFAGRLQLHYLFSRETRREGLRSARPDPDTLRGLLPAIVDPSEIDEWLLCGSQQLCSSAAEVVRTLNGTATVTTELFYARPAGVPAASRTVANGPARSHGPGALTTCAEGRTTTSDLLPDRTVLDSALDGNPDLPFSCTTGVCGTCRARVVAGEVDPGTPWALTPDEVADGHVLTCQARPRSRDLTIDFDLL